jgi:hypothetical protein
MSEGPVWIKEKVSFKSRASVTWHGMLNSCGDVEMSPKVSGLDFGSFLKIEGMIR